MATATHEQHTRTLSRKRARTVFEERVRRRLGIDADEFIKRWRAGDYGAPDDNPDALELAMLLPMIGVDPWRNGERP